MEMKRQVVNKTFFARGRDDDDGLYCRFSLFFSISVPSLGLVFYFHFLVRPDLEGKKIEEHCRVGYRIDWNWALPTIALSGRCLSSLSSLLLRCLIDWLLPFTFFSPFLSPFSFPLPHLRHQACQQWRIQLV